MKANGVPEKIYFDGESKACKLPVFSSQNIEYTRTDAFIEKAYEFISLNVTDYIDVTHKGGIEHLALQERFIENFKKYMEL